MEKEKESSLDSILAILKNIAIILIVVSILWYIISSIYDESKRIISEKDYKKLIYYIVIIIISILFIFKFDSNSNSYSKETPSNNKSGYEMWQEKYENN